MSHAIEADRTQGFLLPPSMEDWLPVDHPARFVADLVDELDLETLGFRVSVGREGRPHYAPGLLLCVWLFGWMDRVRSSRALEKACLRDVAFIWLTGNRQPDHNTLWRFFFNNKKALTNLFKVVIKVAAKAGLVGFALHALDGTKLKAASSMETALHRKKLDEELKKLDEIVEQGVAAIEAGEEQPEPRWGMPQSLQQRDARKKSIRAELALLDAEKTKHLHPKEPDARVMRMRGTTPSLAFNAQAVVDHDSDLIVAIGVSADETDHRQLVPMVQEVLDTFGEVAEQTICDAGYASGEQFEEAERRHLPVLVNVKEESSEKGAYAKSCFTYDAERDAYVCPLGEVLPFETIQNPSTGKPIAMRVYRCHNSACPEQAKCTKDKKGRAIKRLATEGAFQRQVNRQAPPAMRRLMSLRKDIVEHIFAIAKTIDGFSRFTVRGLTAASTQWALVCLAINLRKIWGGGHAHRLLVAAQS